ncbi:MAG TPA: hypothetical protein PKY81_17010 [bacterium]|nr:hypothetical protein [bacterium]
MVIDVNAIIDNIRNVIKENEYKKVTGDLIVVNKSKLEYALVECFGKVLSETVKGDKNEL